MTEKHIAIICSYLNFAGGYERIVVDAANLFAENGLEVTLVLFAETSETFYPINSTITVIHRNVHLGITEKGNPVSRKIKMVKDLATLKTIVKKIKPDVLICTEYYFAISAILCGAKKYSKVISWEHTHYANTIRNFFWEKLFQLTYPKLDSIVCLNKTEEAFFSKFAPAVIIPNFTKNRIGTYSQLDSKTILTIGTLIHRKGIDLLLQSAREVLKKHTDWKWKLIGSGPMKEQVCKLMKDENLHDQFILQDSESSDIGNEYLAADVYVMTSRNETLPMVLLEALSYGLPCISFDCPSGPSEIINHEVDGLLVEKENVTKLTEAISTLIQDEKKRKAMGASASENSKRFLPETVFQRWNRLFMLL